MQTRLPSTKTSSASIVQRSIIITLVRSVTCSADAGFESSYGFRSGLDVPVGQVRGLSIILEGRDRNLADVAIVGFIEASSFNHGDRVLFGQSTRDCQSRGTSTDNLEQVNLCSAAGLRC